MTRRRRTAREIKEAAQAIRDMSRQVLDTHGVHVRYGEIIATSPLRVSVHGIEEPIEETDGDLVLGDTVRRRDADVALGVGDTLVLMLLGDGDWVAVEVISDHEW